MYQAQTVIRPDWQIRLLDWFVRRVRQGGQVLFTSADARATERGWQVQSTRGGLGRSYRDPRFDQLIRCPDCCGTGRTGFDPAPCGPCGGTGRQFLPNRIRTEAWW